MHACIWFLPDFLDWPLEVMKRFSAKHQAWTFSGIVTAPARDLEYLKHQRDPQVAPLYFIDELQLEWLRTPYTSASVQKYESMLGRQTLNRILIADRNVGKGFVTNAEMPETPLMRSTATHDAQMRYVVGLLTFLSEMFETNRPDFVFAPGVAGALALALGEMCHHYGVPFRCLLWTRLGARHTLTSSTIAQSPEIEATFRAALKSPEVVAESREEAHKLLVEYQTKPSRLEKVDGESHEVLPALGLKHLAALIWRAISNRSPELINLPYPAEYLRWELIRRRRVKKILSDKRFIRLDEFPERDFVYFPLHVSPEASTMVLSPLLTDQLAVVEALAKSVPSDMYIVVKEHLPMLGRRPEGFYERLAAYPKVVLISPFENSIRVILRAALTCVITGSAAWEAMVLQKPTLCLGPALYQMIGEGITYCEELSKLADAVEASMTQQPASNETLELYIASVLKESFEFPRMLKFGQTAQTVQAHSSIADEMVDLLSASVGEPASVAAR